MKLKNSTDFPDHFLRRLVSWCCRQSGLPARRLLRAEFRNRTQLYSGHAYSSMRIVCSIGRFGFPTDPDNRPGMDGEIFADRIETLVAITAHEIEHCCQYAEGRGWKLKAVKGSERNTRVHEVRCLRLFRANRDALMAEWGETPPPRIAKPKPTRQELNEKRARAALARWETKLKTAQNKVRKLRAKSRYYDRMAAKRSGA
jgi:hypothetical protein